MHPSVRRTALKRPCVSAFLSKLEAAGQLPSAWMLPRGDPTRYLTLNGSAVEGWAASHGNQKVDLAETTNPPAWDGSLLGNRGGVVFDGINDILSGTGNVSNWPADTDDFWMLFVARNDLAGATSGAKRGFGYGEGDTNSLRYVGRIASGSTNRGLCAAATTTIVSGSLLDGLHTILAYFDMGGTSRLFIDGIADGTVSTASAALTRTRVRMGAAPTSTPNNFWQGPAFGAAIGTASLQDALILEALWRGELG